MRTLILGLAAAAAAAVEVGASSSLPSISQLLEADARYSTFVEALYATDLYDALDAYGPRAPARTHVRPRTKRFGRAKLALSADANYSKSVLRRQNGAGPRPPRRSARQGSSAEATPRSFPPYR